LLESGCFYGDLLRHARIEPAHHVCPWWLRPSRAPAAKKADAAEYPQVFDHVGLLFNEPVAAATCPSSSHPTILISVILGVRPDSD
jgi:hypothetical protein